MSETIPWLENIIAGASIFDPFNEPNDAQRLYRIYWRPYVDIKKGKHECIGLAVVPAKTSPEEHQQWMRDFVEQAKHSKDGYYWTILA